MNHIPLHDFAPEDDPALQHFRYVPLHVRNGYDASLPHRHKYYELFFFHKGGGTHFIDFAEYPVADHSVHMVSPGQVHLLQREPDSFGAVVHFQQEALMALPQSSGFFQPGTSPVLAHTPEVYEAIRTILSQLQQELSGTGTHTETASACFWYLLLKSAAQRRTDHNVREPRTHRVFTAFREMAEKNYRQNKLPAWYAAQLHLTEKRLNEACKEATGLTAGGFLKERILLEARRLLCHSPGSIKEIGYYLGFDDPAYFTRFFKKNTGITAGAFRSRYK